MWLSSAADFFLFAAILFGSFALIQHAFAAATAGLHTAVGMEKRQQAICERIGRRFGSNADLINRRLEKRFGFTCGTATKNGKQSSATRKLLVRNRLQQRKYQGQTTPPAPTAPPQTFNSSTRSVGNDFDSWITYQNMDLGLELQYPPERLHLQAEDEQIILTHAVPFTHSDYCNEAVVDTLNEFTDFHVKIKHFRGTLAEAIGTEHSDFLISQIVDNNTLIQSAEVEQVTIGSLQGHVITATLEGCGKRTYVFPVTDDEFLLVVRTIIGAWYQNRDFYERVAGVILPEQEQHLFENVVSTLRVINK